MQLRVKKAISEDKKQCHFIVSVPPTRSDILHACDVVEVFYYYVKTFVLIYLELIYLLADILSY